MKIITPTIDIWQRVKALNKKKEPNLPPSLEIMTNAYQIVVLKRTVELQCHLKPNIKTQKWDITSKEAVTHTLIWLLHAIVTLKQYQGLEFESDFNSVWNNLKMWATPADDPGGELILRLTSNIIEILIGTDGGDELMFFIELCQAVEVSREEIISAFSKEFPE